MKTWPLLIGIIVILALVCSPVLAISKSELISQYKTGYFPGPTTPTPMPTTIPTTGPTHIPTGTGTGALFVTSYPCDADVYLDGEWIGVAPSYYTILSDDYDPNAYTLTGIPAGPHQIKVTKEGLPDYITSVTVTAGETTYVYALLAQTPPDLTPTVIPTTVPTQAPSNWPYPIIPDSYTKTKSSYLDSLGTKTDDYGDRFSMKSSDPGTAIYDNVKKPNIYLYSDRDLIAQVRLAPEQAITVSEPAYQPGKGWMAEVWNGSLNGKGDFLFYEGLVPDAGWQKKQGYLIHADYREQDMTSMLGQYNFNEKETVEFIEYWSHHLAEDVTYVFYPQETSAVNRVMPLYISPEPDHVMRIWFYAEPFVSAPEPVTNPEQIVRIGFYVVEWGVIIGDEYWMNHSPASSGVVL